MWASLLVKCKSAKEMAVEPESEYTWVIWYQGPRSFKHVEKVMLYINWHFTSDSQLHPNHTSHQEQSCRTGGSNFARHYSRCMKLCLGGSLHMIISDTYGCSYYFMNARWEKTFGRHLVTIEELVRRVHLNTFQIIPTILTSLRKGDAISLFKPLLENK